MKEGKNFEKIKQKEDLSSVLDRYFKNEELSEEELKIVEKHRKECIEEVKEKSYKFSDIGSGLGIPVPIEGFTWSAGWDLDLRIGNLVSNRDEEFEIFEGKTVIDLGAGRIPKGFARAIMFFGPKKYVAVDVEPPGIELFKEDMKGEMEKGQELESVESDMLEYLLTVKDESSIVVSSGSTKLGEVIRGKRSSDYLHFLAHEIARVTPEKSITYHYEHHPLFANYLEEEGFERVEDKQADDHVSGLWVKASSKKEKEE